MSIDGTLCMIRIVLKGEEGRKGEAINRGTSQSCVVELLSSPVTSSSVFLMQLIPTHRSTRSLPASSSRVLPNAGANRFSLVSMVFSFLIGNTSFSFLNI